MFESRMKQFAIAAIGAADYSIPGDPRACMRLTYVQPLQQLAALCFVLTYARKTGLQASFDRNNVSQAFRQFWGCSFEVDLAKMRFVTEFRFALEDERCHPVSRLR